MRYGFIVPEGDPRAVVELAREAEQAADWDGVFYYDAWYGPLAGASRWILEFFHEEASLLGGPCLGGSR